MKTKPKISVVTISYNQGKYLEDAMKSILDQDYDNVEYIVIDGGSTDNSVDIIKKYKDQLYYWCSEKDNGPASALNKGFSKATGDLYYYLNSDDVLMPGIFTKMVDFINQHPNYDFYYGHGYITKGTLEEKFKIYSDLWDLDRYRRVLASVSQQSTFFTPEYFHKVNGFNENNRTMWDGELIVDMALAGSRFKRHNFHTAIFRVYPESFNGNEDNVAKWKKDRDRVGEKIAKHVKSSKVPRPLALLSKFFIDPYVMFSRLLPK